MTWFWHTFFENFCKEAQVSGQLVQKKHKKVGCRFLMYEMPWFWQSFLDNFCKKSQVSGQLLEKNASFWKHAFLSL